MAPIPTFHLPTFPFKFSLDLAGVASLLGGDDAVSAMTAVPVYEYRRWLGWYNSPGCFQLAKRFNLLKTSLPSKPCSDGTWRVDLTALLAQDRGKSPKFRGAHSGTNMEETGYLAALFMKECAAQDLEVQDVQGRTTKPVEITIADLKPAPEEEMRPARTTLSFFAAILPVIVSILTIVLCVVRGDLVATFLILLGVIACGVSAYVLGCAEFVFTHHQPAGGSPPGDGILRLDSAIVLLRGEEGAVNSITRGSFSLCFASQAQCNRICFCSRLFLFQGLTQLFLIPHASPLGQFAFLTSMGVSALHNAWLSSLDKEKIHRKALFEQVLQRPRLLKYKLGTYTTAVVFMLLVLELKEPNDLLKELLPNDTVVWRQWKEAVLQGLRNPNHQSFRLERRDARPLPGFATQDMELLESLLKDARSAYEGYQDYLRRNNQVI